MECLQRTRSSVFCAQVWFCSSGRNIYWDGSGLDVPISQALCFAGVKVSDSIHGCLSGGVVLLVRKELCEYVERIDVETDNIIALRLSHWLLGTPSDCLLVGTYLPHEKSPYYEETDIYNGVYLLEDCLLDLIRVCGDIPFIICGDLNARTAFMNARDVDPIDDICEMNSDNHSESRTPVDNDTRRTS